MLLKVLLLLLTGSCHAAQRDDDITKYGERLYLTPLIRSGMLNHARQAAKVPSLIPGKNIVSYAGFLTVNATYNSNLYFWFFPAEKNSNSAPVVVWLQGGPGGSSLYGLFNENGPLVITHKLTLKLRQFYWSQELNVIYIDNPVGTGFSFTDDDAGYATNQIQVGENLYSAVRQFFELFPQYQKNEFFVTGESYAGKYVPALCYTIHKKNSLSKLKINLAGLAVGDGWIDPVHMMVYSSYLYQHGFIDRKTQRQMATLESKVVKLINTGHFHEANNVWSSILVLLSTYAGNIDEYQYLVANPSSWDSDSINALFNKSEVRRSIHVGNLTYHSGSKVYNKLFDDMPKSVAPWLELLMENYRVLLYNGQLDIIVAYPLTTNFVEQLKWSGAAAYAQAPRKQWYVGNRLAGYSINVGNFTQVLIRDAGHMVPAMQPRWALDLINKFTRGVPLNSKPQQTSLEKYSNKPIKL